jgi:Glyoxalase/Bleomycin resistance protein/Dioxygenase superfamily
MGNQTGCNNTGVHHVGLRAANPAASAEFYRDVLGMEIVGGSDADHPLGATAFLSSRPNQESHEIALFANPAFAHIAFKVSYWPSCGRSTRVLWRRTSRSSSQPTTACPSRSISTTLTAT